MDGVSARLFPKDYPWRRVLAVVVGGGVGLSVLFDVLSNLGLYVMLLSNKGITPISISSLLSDKLVFAAIWRLPMALVFAVYLIWQRKYRGCAVFGQVSVLFVVFFPAGFFLSGGSYVSGNGAFFVYLAVYGFIFEWLLNLAVYGFLAADLLPVGRDGDVPPGYPCFRVGLLFPLTVGLLIGIYGFVVHEFYGHKFKWPGFDSFCFLFGFWLFVRRVRCNVAGVLHAVSVFAPLAVWAVSLFLHPLLQYDGELFVRLFVLLGGGSVVIAAACLLVFLPPPPGHVPSRRECVLMALSGVAWGMFLVCSAVFFSLPECMLGALGLL